MRSVQKYIAETWRNLPELVRFLILHAAIGVGAGWFLLALLLGTDTNGIGALIWKSETPALAIAMLGTAFSTTFGGAAAAAAVMMISPDSGGPRR